MQFFDSSILICPTAAASPFAIEQRFPVEVAGEKLTTHIDRMFLTSFVGLMLAGCPVISLPCRLDRDAPRIGIQLMGRPHGDAELRGMHDLPSRHSGLNLSSTFAVAALPAKAVR